MAFVSVSRWLVAVTCGLMLTGGAAAPAVAAEGHGRLEARADRLNGHPVRLDGAGRLLPWNGPVDRAYAGVCRLAWGYLLDDVPDDEGNGRPAYLSHSYLNPETGEPVNWPHNPAGLYAMLVESALRYHAFSGDTRVLALARRVVDHQLANGMTERSDAWSHVPYASGTSGSLTYRGAPPDGRQAGSGDGVGIIEPDKVGELGHALVQLYELTGARRYLDAAVDAADALAEHRRPGSGTESIWPFRVRAADDETVEPYTASVTGPIELFDDLLRLDVGDTAAYRSARAAVWRWTMRFPMRTDHWSQYFEDVETHVPSDENLNQLTAMNFARYLLEHPAADPRWRPHVRHLLGWVRQTFGVRQQGGAMTIREQQAFFYPMGSHTSRYAAVSALFGERTGDAAARRSALGSFAWAGYMTRDDGVVIDGPEVGNQWFTDGYGDYVQHFLVGMSALPELAPDGATHVLDSTSVVRRVDYRGRGVAYTTSGPGTERVKLAGPPRAVRVDGRRLPRGAGVGHWSYDRRSDLLVLRRGSRTGERVVVTVGR